MAAGILGRKIGMTSVYRDGKSIPVTVVEAGPCPVVHVKSAEGPDGYSAVQLGFIPKKEHKVTKPMAGHFGRAGVKPVRILREFRGESDKQLGDTIRVEEVLAVGDIIHVRGTSKGHGYSGVIRRHNFHGHKASHGTHESFRGPGSIGACAWPSRVWKGKRMAGQYGNVTSSTKNLEVIEIIADKNLVLVKGAVPGSRNSVVELHKREK